MSKSIYISLISISAFAMGFFLVWPQYNQYHALAQSITDKQIEYSGKYAYYANVDRLVKEIQSKSESVDKVSSALPENFAIAPVIYFFHKEAQSNGLTVDSITLSRSARSSLSTEEKSVKKVSFAIHLTGQYQGWRQFLGSLETSGRLFQANNVVVRRVESEDGSFYTFDMQIETNTY